MPKQNRPLVRDGRLQGPKKRTDRSYLRPTTAPPADDASADEPALDAIDAVDDVIDEGETAEVTPVAAPAPTQPEASAVQGRPMAAQRALQQQGVRKRREFDVHDLAVRDSRYAMHELRRIAIVSAIIVATLVVLAIVL
jgi:hypothetical protein